MRQKPRRRSQCENTIQAIAVLKNVVSVPLSWFFRPNDVDPGEEDDEYLVEDCNDASDSDGYVSPVEPGRDPAGSKSRSDFYLSDDPPAGGRANVTFTMAEFEYYTELMRQKLVAVPSTVPWNGKPTPSNSASEIVPAVVRPEIDSVFKPVPVSGPVSVDAAAGGVSVATPIASTTGTKQLPPLKVIGIPSSIIKKRAREGPSQPIAERSWKRLSSPSRSRPSAAANPFAPKMSDGSDYSMDNQKKIGSQMPYTEDPSHQLSKGRYSNSSQGVSQTAQSILQTLDRSSAISLLRVKKIGITTGCEAQSFQYTLCFFALIQQGETADGHSIAAF